MVGFMAQNTNSNLLTKTANSAQNKMNNLKEFRKTLPIYAKREEIVSAVESLA